MVTRLWRNALPNEVAEVQQTLERVRNEIGKSFVGHPELSERVAGGPAGQRACVAGRSTRTRERPSSYVP
jgi:hypothetical protein